MLSLQRLLTKLRSREAKVATAVAAADPEERYRAAVMDAAAGRELDPDKIADLLAELERTADDFAADVEGAIESRRDRDAIASLEATRRKRADVQDKIAAAVARGDEFARQVAEECKTLIAERDRIDEEIRRVEFLRSTKLKNPPPELAVELQAAWAEIGRIEKRIPYIADAARNARGHANLATGRGRNASTTEAKRQADEEAESYERAAVAHDKEFEQLGRDMNRARKNLADIERRIELS